MKVLLVNPPTPLKERLFAIYPLGLFYMASALKQSGHQTQILDLYSFGGEISQRLVKDYDVIGITGMSFQHNMILKVAEAVKGFDREKPVVVGGSHASALPSLLLTNRNIDFVIRGEGEYALLLLLKAINNEPEWQNIPGLCFRVKADDHIAPPTMIADIDSLPMPAWDLINLTKYRGYHHGFFYEREPIGRIITSRGCPHLCTFCASHIISGKKWRPHSVERVMSEIEYLIRKLGIRELQIEDDNFTFNMQRAKEICREIIKQKYDIKISFPNGIRVERLDDELLELMKRAGVYSITFGIESGSPRILKLMKKGISLDYAEKQIRKVKSHGFYVHAFFIVGFPHETREDIEKTIAFALRVPLDAAFFGTYVPLPSSQDFEELVSKGKLRVKSMNWDNIHSSKVSDTSFHLTPQEIKQLQTLATRRFYLRASIFLKALLRIRRLHQFRALLERIRAAIF